MDLPQYANAFAIHEVDGPTLLELTEETLENPLGIVEALKRKKILGHVKLLKIRNAPSPTGDAGPSRQRRRTPRSDAASGQSTPRQVNAGVVVRPGQAVQQLRRSRSAGPGSVGNKTPRSVSASSERSIPNSMSMNSLGEQASIYSDYVNSNQMITGGLVSNFGVDSPSFSRTGSFPRSMRKAAVFPGVQPLNPGPDCYQEVSSDSINRMLRNQPRATIGRSPRNTAEYVAPHSASPGVGKYDTSGQRTKAFKGHLFDSTPRLNYSASQTNHWLRPRYTPGPTDYRPHRGYDSTFRMH